MKMFRREITTDKAEARTLRNNCLHFIKKKKRKETKKKHVYTRMSQTQIPNYWVEGREACVCVCVCVGGGGGLREAWLIQTI